jgi:enterochelin esterase family protein
MRRPRIFQFPLLAVVLFISALPAASWAGTPKATLKTPHGFPDPTIQNKAAEGHAKDYKYQSSVLTDPKTNEGAWRNVKVYTPHGYDETVKYPVLYLLHGHMSSYEDWKEYGYADVIIDNLISNDQIPAMIVVMPENRCRLDQKNAAGQYIDDRASYLRFEGELINDLVPFINSTFSTGPVQALAGCSEGAEQALFFGWSNPGLFTAIGAFSPGDDLVKHVYQNLLPVGGMTPCQFDNNPAWPSIWLSCGNVDTTGKIPICDDLRTYMKKEEITHTFNFIDGGHTWPVWQVSLYYFAQAFSQ